MLGGRVALVTGSTRGIGLGILRALAREGADVVMHGIDGLDTELDAVAQSIAADHDVTLKRSNADLRQPTEIRAMIQRIHSDFGKLDILVNNAGIQHVAAVEEMPDDRWDAILAIILTSSFHTIKHALPRMKEEGWGRIINTGSMHALVASPYKSAYNAAKHGVAGLTKTVALETAQTGITCNSICPGYAFTDLVRNQLEDTARVRQIPKEQVISEVLLKDQPTKRFVEVDDIGALVELCPSAEGSGLAAIVYLGSASLWAAFFEHYGCLSLHRWRMDGTMSALCTYLARLESL